MQQRIVQEGRLSRYQPARQVPPLRQALQHSRITPEQALRAAEAKTAVEARQRQMGRG